MTDQTPTPWGQTTAGVFVIQGLIGPVIGAVAGVVITLAVTQPDKVNWLALVGVGLGVAVVMFLLISFFARGLRQLVWGNLFRFFKWLFGVRPLTRDQRTALTQEGYDKRDAELKEERKRSLRPTWRVSHEEGDDFIYIHNSGYWVEDVVVRADPDLFVFADDAKEGFLKGRLGDNSPGGSSGKQVPGELTLEGKKQGVTFELSWTDQNGDPQPGTGGAGLPNIATLPATPLKRVVQPTWQIGQPKQNPGKDIWGLVNGSEGSVTNNVFIDADPNFFTFALKKELGNLVGPGLLRFAGRPTDGGALWGVTFYVTYEDVNGEEHTDEVPAKFGFGF